MCVYILTNTSVSSFHSAWTVRLYKIFFSFVSSLKDAILCTTFTLARYVYKAFTFQWLTITLTNIQASGIDCLFVQKCNEKKQMLVTLKIFWSNLKLTICFVDIIFFKFILQLVLCIVFHEVIFLRNTKSFKLVIVVWILNAIILLIYCIVIF